MASESTTRSLGVNDAHPATPLTSQQPSRNEEGQTTTAMSAISPMSAMSATPSAAAGFEPVPTPVVGMRRGRDDNDDYDGALARAFIKRIRKYGNVGALLPFREDFRRDYDVMLAAVQLDGMMLRYALDGLNDEDEIVMAAVTNSGKALEFATDWFMDDVDVVTAAVKSDGFALTFATERLKNNATVVRAAVERSPPALKYATGDMQKDRDVVMTAVQKTGPKTWSPSALKYADATLQDDFGVVMAAVKTTGLALEFASVRLRTRPSEASVRRGDPADRQASQIISAAIANNSYARKFISFG